VTPGLSGAGADSFATTDWFNPSNKQTALSARVILRIVFPFVLISFYFYQSEQLVKKLSDHTCRRLTIKGFSQK